MNSPRLTRIGPGEPRQLNRSHETPGQLLVLVDDYPAGRETRYYKGRARLVDQNLEPVGDMQHDLALAPVVEMLELIDHHHTCSGFPHQDS